MPIREGCIPARPRASHVRNRASEGFMTDLDKHDALPGPGRRTPHRDGKPRKVPENPDSRLDIEPREAP